MRTIIDMSHWQDNKGGQPPDLAKAKANGVDGFLFRAGRGVGTVNSLDFDPSFQMFVEQAEILSMPWGGYWWPEPNESNPVIQAELFWGRMLSEKPSALPLDVDIESYRGNRLSALEYAKWIRGFIDELKHLSNKEVMIYTRGNVWNLQIAPSGIDFSDCNLRVAHFYKDSIPPVRATQWNAWLAGRQPNSVQGWTKWDAWQFSADGNGLGPHYGAESNDIDLNVVSETAWERWNASTLETLSLRVVDLTSRLESTRVALIDGLTRVSEHTEEQAEKITARWIRVGEALSRP